MSKRIVAISAMLILGLLGCQDSEEGGPTSIILGDSAKMSLRLQVPTNLNIDSGEITITKGDLEYSQSVDLQDGSATVVFEDIQPGIWMIHVALYDADGFMLYEGSGEAEVHGGESASAHIILTELSGDLEIEISLPGTISVPGTSDPWLAGMPDGSNASGNDYAPEQSPVYIENLLFEPGDVLVFTATGGVGHGPTQPLNPPDGHEDDLTSHNHGAENGISNIVVPFCSLVGLFLDDSQPNQTPAPDALDFSSVESRNYTELPPLLKQVFFIGDGVTSDGTPQEIIVPANATRLFLGTMDSWEWNNNYGSFDVHVSACGGQTDCIDSPSGLIGWWPGDGSAEDLVGGNNGDLLGELVYGSGMVEAAFAFDDVDDGIEIPNTEGVFDLVDEWTVMAWVYPFAPGWDQRNDPIIWKTNLGTEDTFSLAWGCSGCSDDPNRFVAGLERASDGHDFGVRSEPHQHGAWYHIAGVYDGADMIIYVNGAEDGRESIGSVIAYVNPDPLRIGNILHANHAHAGVFDGLIDEAAVFDRALLPEEIAAIHQAGSAGMCKD